MDILSAERAELSNGKLISRHHAGACRRERLGASLKSAAVRLLSLLFLCSALGRPTLLPAQAKAATEYEIKAAFLYNFAKFVQWPASAFNDPRQPMGICVFGRDPFGRALEDTLLGKSIGGRPVLLGRAKQVSDLAGCQVIFLPAEVSLRLAEIMGSLRNRNVLIVGEAEGFAAGGGTIQFVLDQNRVRFVINPDAAERAGLKISSKLLALAVIVHDAERSAQAKN